MSDDTLARIETRLDNIHEDLHDMDDTMSDIDNRVRSLEARAMGVAYAVAGLGLLATVMAILAALSGCTTPVMVRAEPPHDLPDIAPTVAIVDEAGNAHCAGVRTSAGVLTAAHCLEPDMRIADASSWVPDPVGGHFAASYRVDVIRVDGGADLALLGPAGGPVAPLGDRAVLGDHVVLVGMPYGQPFIAARGFVASSQCTDIAPCLQYLDINAGPGDSGGPVYSWDGHLVGLLVQGVGSPGSSWPVHLMVPADTISQFLRRP
jgi:hypothetical protein